MSSAITAVAITSFVSNKAARKQQQAAADAQAQALGYQNASEQRALEEQQRQFDLTREDTATQRQVGDQALNYLSGALQPGGEFAPQQFNPGDFQADPGYQFRLQQGAQARGNALGAGGMMLSGRAQKELERYGQDYGSNEYSNWYNRELGEFQQSQADKQNYLSRQFGLAGIGSQGINTATSAGANMANQASNIITGTGANRANIATQYGADTANIQGNRINNIGNAVTSASGNYLAMQQQNKMNDMWKQYYGNRTQYKPPTIVPNN